jgi:hypothetical protein
MKAYIRFRWTLVTQPGYLYVQGLAAKSPVQAHAVIAKCSAESTLADADLLAFKLH